MKLAFATAVLLLGVGSAAAQTKVTVKAYGQCGGKSNCATIKGATCADAAWSGAQCAAGSKCVRDNEYYHQCKPNDAPAAKPGNSGSAAKSAAPAKPVKPQPGVNAKKTAQGDFDYAVPLKLSNWFYRAQRSGKLPKSNGVPWRADSGLKHNYKGKDVTGGWYDAGDNVKFNHPMAWSSTVLGWSVLEFADGYAKAGELTGMLENVKWANDYFLRCIIDKTTVVGQVGNGQQDHSLWTRPEDAPQDPPVYVITKERPGSDVAGSMGASLAVASLIWMKRDPAYSAKLLTGAKTLYEFGTQYKGFYSTSIPDAGNFYKSNNYYDDLALLALWLHVRTGEAKYLQEGIKLYDTHWKAESGNSVWSNFDWDSNSWACVVLLAKLNPGNPQYKQRMQSFVNDWAEGKGPWVKFTPKGLGVGSSWGSLRHTGNAMFLLKTYAKVTNNAGLAKKVDCFAHKQLRYILGGTGESFVVGYGNNAPQQPHHRAASCPSDISIPCDYNNGYNPDAPNPNVIYGALVGGPDTSDKYNDKRSDFQQNEVACDYNAGYTGALAAMISSGSSSKQCVSY